MMNEPASILVVDDNPADLKLISSVLISKGYNVTVAAEAPQGIEAAMDLKPDLIVLDVMMPIINGFNICRLIKDQADCRHIPILLLTSRSTEEDRRIGEEVGANAYLTKPFKSDEFLNTVNNLLNR